MATRRGFIGGCVYSATAAAASAACSSGRKGASRQQLDHIIWAVPDLDRGAAFLEDKGASSIVGGVHPGRGTRNRLVSAGPRCYLEIIAPDPQQAPYDVEREPVKAFAKAVAGLSVPEVDMFVFAAEDLEDVARRGRELGLEVVGPTPGARELPGGGRVEWTHVDFLGHDFGQCMPFAINWGRSDHPGSTSPGALTLHQVSVFHPQHEALRRIYEGLGVPARVVPGSKPQIVVSLSVGKERFELRSGEGLGAYYAGRSARNI